MKTNSILKSFVKNKISFYSNSFLFGMLGALIVMILSHFVISPKPSIGAVNITGLVDRFIKSETAKNLPPDVLKQDVREFGRNLERELKLISQKHNVVLFPTEAVITGSQDYTALIKERLNQK